MKSSRLLGAGVDVAAYSHQGENTGLLGADICVCQRGRSFLCRGQRGGAFACCGGCLRCAFATVFGLHIQRSLLRGG